MILSVVIFFCVSTQSTYAVSRDVKIGTVYMAATHEFSSPLSTKINEVAPLIAEAGRQNLDLVVLPEAYFKGGNYSADAQDLNSSQVLDSMKVYAKENNINLIFQVYEIESSNLYNTAVVLNRNGDFVGKYRKVNLPPEESSLSPGDSFPVFDLDFGKVGILICWDFWFTDPAKILAQNGAELIVLPTWCNIRRNLNTITAENGLPVVISALRLDCGSGDEDLPSGVYNHQGKDVFTNYSVGTNNLAVGSVTLGNYQNLALNKSVQTSSGTDSENQAENAIDDVYSTERDALAEMQTSWKATSLPQWIEIDLGENYNVDQVVIAQFNSDEYNYIIEGKLQGQEFEILADDFTKLETFLEHGIAGSEILCSKFQLKYIRYLKLTINSSTETDLTINEIKVFGYTDSSLTSIDDKEIKRAPTGYKMLKNYPNPFNPETIIQYTIPENSDVNLLVFNIGG